MKVISDIVDFTGRELKRLVTVSCLQAVHAPLWDEKALHSEQKGSKKAADGEFTMYGCFLIYSKYYDNIDKREAMRTTDSPEIIKNHTLHRTPREFPEEKKNIYIKNRQNIP